MRQRVTGIAPILLLILIVAIPTTLLMDNYKELPEDFQIFTNIVTVISSSILLAIGIKLYKRFSGTQAIVDKQTERVIKLVGLLSNARFSIVQIHKDGKEGNGALNVTIHGYKTHIKTSYKFIPESDYSKKELYVSASILGFLEPIWELKDDPYMPKNIAYLLRDNFGLMTQAKFNMDDLDEEYLIFSPLFGEKSNSLLWKPGDVMKIMGEMKKAYDACNTWLKDYNDGAYGSLNLIPDKLAIKD